MHRASNDLQRLAAVVCWLACTLLACPFAAVAESPTEKEHADWAFRPVVRPEVPTVGDRLRVRTPVDAFVVARLEQQGLSLAAEADRRTLLRRLTFDLTGLPPTPEQVDAFVNDRRADAYARVVERLLASPHYGERWAQHWLDVVRYADSDGFEYDDPRPDAWRYRDWVIDSLNEDKPYDRFVQEQIAGDELFPGDRQALVATAMHRLAPLRLNAGNQDEEKNRQEVLTEMTDCIGSAFLGITLQCARCHDHKFDAIRQSDYYQVQAFFAATVAKDVPLATAEEVTAHQKRMAAWKQRIEDIKKRIAALQADDRAEREQLKAELAAVQQEKPAPLPSVMAVADEGPDAPATYVLRRGEPGQHLDEVAPAFPSALVADIQAVSLLRDPEPASAGATTGRRAALARWITSPKHPLTARVMVNRIWQHHFGRGLVTTPNDFGTMGQPPTHPLLLDWLASEFVARDWSIKEMHRLIVLSSTYRQGRWKDSAPAVQVDPQNTLYWQMPRRRLDAEQLRDSVLAVAGTLNGKQGGPGVFVPLRKEVTNLIYKGTWEATANPAEHNRRTIYLFLKRNLRPPLLEAFDSPSTMASCAQRSVSTHAGQSLAMLNGTFVDEQSQGFAQRLLREEGWEDKGAIVDRAYRLALARRPSDLERAAAIDFLAQQSASIDFAGSDDLHKGADAAFVTALADFCLVMLNLEEFMFLQ